MKNAEQQQSFDRAVSEKREKIGEVEILRATLQKVECMAWNESL
jgi:hypothetical protein